MIDTVKTLPIAETNNFIILDQYTKIEQPSTYQTESDLERELIADLQHQGYEYLTYLRTPEALLDNLRLQLETLNHVSFTEKEW